MSINLNHLTLAGNLTRDPQIRFLAGDRCVASFGVANSRRYKTAGGETKEETLFLDCEAWGKTGEHIGRYFMKGKPIIVEGRLRQDTWTDKETNKPRSKSVLVVERFHFVPDGKGKADGDAAEPPAPPQPPANVEHSEDAPAPAPGTPPRTPAPGDDEPPF
jgi:single-strand DNA-binding protein